MTPELEPVWKQFEETYAALRDALAQLPEDRLAWKPGPAATAAVEIVAHVMRANRRYSIIAAGAEWTGHRHYEIPDRARLLELLAESETGVRSTFEQLQPDDLKRVCAEEWAPLGPEVAGPLDALWFCHQIVRHTAYHLGQVNYLLLLIEGGVAG